MGRHRSLGFAGGARGVEDRGVVTGIDLDIGHRGAGGAHILESVDTGRRLTTMADRNHPEPGQAIEDGRHALGPLLIGDEHGGARVAQPVLELVGGPPGVQRHRHRADGGDGGEARHPLGVVAHADGHAVTALHAVVLDQQMTGGVDLRDHVGEGQALVLVHEVHVVGGSRTHGVEEHAKRRRGAVEDRHGLAADRLVVHRERRHRPR